MTYEIDSEARGHELPIVLDTTKPLNRSDVECLKQAGFVAVGRYFSRDLPAIRLTRSEAETIVHGELTLFSIFKAADCDKPEYFTFENGTEDGKYFNQQALLIGQPWHSCVYVVVDLDVGKYAKSSTELEGDIRSYLLGFSWAAYSVSGLGLYGSGWLLQRAQDNWSSLGRTWLAQNQQWAGYQSYYDSEKWTLAQIAPSKTCQLTVGRSRYFRGNATLGGYNALRSLYQIGGWTQDWDAQAPASFSYAMYGMVTDLKHLKTGGGCSPKTDKAPVQPAGGAQVLWTYGGAGCAPENRPEMGSDITVGTKRGWRGIDFDDECSMDYQAISNLMFDIKQTNPYLQTSYTFLAGSDYTDFASDIAGDSSGKHVNEAVAFLANSPHCDRLVLMCYGQKMWEPKEIDCYVHCAIERTIVTHGCPSKRVFLALTTAGLNDSNLNTFLGFVTSNQLGGLFVWNFTNLKKPHRETIEKTLKIPKDDFTTVYESSIASFPT